uniref:Glutathione S-transferase omega 2 n=1 Tax=Heortia vitessoides TaxID=1557813 RepID=A0A3G1RJ69_9NEOP|nr:glutathione S-transferase omega 2 [Heortia vitessoides]
MWSWKVLKSTAPTSCKLCRNLTSAVKTKINFNTKHLKNGDALPPYNGTLRVYNMRFCPFAQRTILALNAKEIDYEVINIALMNRPDWIYEKSALGKVPALEIKENVTIYESLVTVEYLDEVYSNRPLLPNDPVQKAQDKMVVEASGGIHNLFFKLVKRPDSINDENIFAFRKSLDIIQEQLEKRGSKFLYGDVPGYVDYMIWPWFERLIAFEGVDDRARIDTKRYGVLLKYIEYMMEDPAVSQYIIPGNVFHQFHSGFKNDLGPNYDLLC